MDTCEESERMGSPWANITSRVCATRGREHLATIPVQFRRWVAPGTRSSAPGGDGVDRDKTCCKQTRRTWVAVAVVEGYLRSRRSTCPCRRAGRPEHSSVCLTRSLCQLSRSVPCAKRTPPPHDTHATLGVVLPGCEPIIRPAPRPSNPPARRGNLAART